MLDKELFNTLILKYQDNFPLSSRPFQVIANELGMKEEEIRVAFSTMLKEKIITRIGPVFETNRVGRSYLAALKCPEDRLEEVSSIVSSFSEVNHNYERENELNIWFVVTGKSEEHLESVKKSIESKTGLVVYPFEMIRPFKINLSLKSNMKMSVL